MSKNFCGNCGNRLEPGDQFCGECGQSTNVDAPSVGEQHQQLQPQPGVSHQNHVSKPTEKKKSKLPVVIAGVVIVLLLVAGGMFLFSPDDNSQDAAKHTSDDKAQGADQVEPVNDDKKVKATKPLNEMTTEDLMGEYDFFFVPEDAESGQVQNYEKATMAITYADGHHYMDFFDFANDDTTWIDYEDGKLSGSVHTELSDIEVEGVVEIVDNEIVMSGRLNYQNYDKQESLSGTWATSKSKAEALAKNKRDDNSQQIEDNSNPDESVGMQHYKDIDGIYEGYFVLQKPLNEEVLYFEDNLNQKAELKLSFVTNDQGDLFISVNNGKIPIQMKDGRIQFEMETFMARFYFDAEITTQSPPYAFKGTLKARISDQPNTKDYYLGEWALEQTKVVQDNTQISEDNVVMTNYLYQPGYRYDFEQLRDDGNTYTHQILTFRVPGKTYSSFILVVDGEYQQMRHYYIKDESVYSYLDGEEANASFYMTLNPSVGDTWDNDFATKKVESVGGSYNLNGEEYSPLLVIFSQRSDGQGAYKSYYAPKVGFVKTEYVEGYQDRTELVNRVSLSDADKEMIQTYYPDAMY